MFDPRADMSRPDRSILAAITATPFNSDGLRSGINSIVSQYVHLVRQSQVDWADLQQKLRTASIKPQGQHVEFVSGIVEAA